MGKSVGLEIHPRGVRAVEVTGTGKNMRVQRYIETALVPRGGSPDPEELQDALNAIFRGAKFSKNHVVTSLPADEAVVREIPVPFKSDDQIRKVIKYEAEHHLHDCDADDVIVQYTRIGESGDGVNLLIFAVRKTDISRRIEYARGSGVEPLAMDLDAAALFTVVKASGELDKTPSCVLLNIQNRATELVFVQNGAVRALRSVRLGVDSISQGLARDMDIDIAEADIKLDELSGDAGELDLLVPDGEPATKRETEKSHAELEQDLFIQKRDDFVARLRREYVRSSAGLRSGPSPERVLATGPGLNVKGLVELLGDRLGITVDTFSPSQCFPTKLNGQQKEFETNSAVVLGLALKGLGNDPLGLDFRREELKVANKFELLKSTLAVTTTLAFLGLMALSFFFVYKRRSLIEGRYEHLAREAFKSFSEAARKYNELGGKLVSARETVDANQVENDGPRPEAIKRFVRRLKRMRTKLTRDVGDEKGLPPITSALTMWNDVFGVVNRLHKELEYIDFERIIIKQDKVEIAVIVPSVHALELLEPPISSLKIMQGMKFDEDYSITSVPDTNKKRATLEWNRPKSRRRGR